MSHELRSAVERDHRFLGAGTRPGRGRERISHDPNLANVALQIDRRAVHQVAVESVGQRGQVQPGRGNAVVRAEQTTDAA